MPGRILRNGTNTTVDLTTPGYVEIDATGGGEGGISDGDKGDITVSGSGVMWTINNGAVTAAKVAADVATQAELDAAIATRQPLARTIGTQAGATYTLAASDCYTYLRLTNASPDLTVPDDGDVTWPVGGWVEIFASGGAITFVEDTAVTINVAAGQSLIGEDAGSMFYLIKVAANTWDLAGRLAA